MCGLCCAGSSLGVGEELTVMSWMLLEGPRRYAERILTEILVSEYGIFLIQIIAPLCKSQP